MTFLNHKIYNGTYPIKPKKGHHIPWLLFFNDSHQCGVYIDSREKKQYHNPGKIVTRKNKNKHTDTTSWQLLTQHPGKDTSTKPTTAKRGQSPLGQ